MFGIDIYSGDKGIDLSLGDYSFVILKATEGRGFVDPEFQNYVFQLSGMNKLIGCYHFARPDKRTDILDATKEIDDFIKVVTEVGMLGKAVLAIDWEQNPIDRIDMLQAMCEHVEKTTGIIPFIYASLSFFKKYKDVEWMKKYPKWVAYWTQIGTVDVGTMPKNMALNYEYDIWQYTENGKYPNLKNKIDLNYTTMSALQWKRYASPNMMLEEYLSTDMKWAIENGLFVGYPSGLFYPEGYITRGQVATVLHRFYDKFIKE